MKAPQSPCALELGLALRLRALTRVHWALLKNAAANIAKNRNRDLTKCQQAVIGVVKPLHQRELIGWYLLALYPIPAVNISVLGIQIHLLRG